MTETAKLCPRIGAVSPPPLKVLVVFGTRPEAIKLAPVIQELRRRCRVALDANPGARELRVVVSVTAQHREMLDQVLRLFRIAPDYDLDVMEREQTPTQVVAAVLTGLEGILEKERPDWVLVQGDTTTAAAAALAAFYSGLKVGHVEAGLRSQDKWQPFPEEINRRVAGVIADLHFAPTEGARSNLLGEGVPSERIVVTGNPVIDALHWVLDQPVPRQTRELLLRCGQGDPNHKRRLLLVTAHRRENFGPPLERICGALRELAERFSESISIVYPVHLNPNVWAPVHRCLDGVPNITLVPPLDYLPLIHLMARSYLILTDSGGIQEEAPSLGKPVLVLRDVTERPEGVESGVVRIVGSDPPRIVDEVTRLLRDADEYNRMAHAVNLYGDGHAAERIVEALLQ